MSNFSAMDFPKSVYASGGGSAGVWFRRFSEDCNQSMRNVVGGKLFAEDCNFFRKDIYNIVVPYLFAEDCNEKV